MAVSPEVSRAHMERELRAARTYAEEQGWMLEVFDDLKLRATISAPAPALHAAETYVFEFHFDNYRELPPLIDAVHPATGERNTPRCFPSGGKGYFYGGTRICAPWSRNAYANLGGPHPDWPVGDWAANAKHHREIGTILALLGNLLRDPSYQGRLAQ